MDSTTNDIRNNLGNVKENVKQGANSIRQSVEQEIDAAGWQERYEELRERAATAVDASQDFVKAHPYYTILGAATVGFVAGMLLRRK